MTDYDDLVATVARWEQSEKDKLIAKLKPISLKLASWALARFAEGFTAEAVRNALKVQNDIVRAERLTPGVPA